MSCKLWLPCHLGWNLNTVNKRRGRGKGCKMLLTGFLSYVVSKAAEGSINAAQVHMISLFLV